VASPLSRYAYINAKLRARISKILASATFDQLAKAPSLDAALAVLRDTAFAGLEGIYARTGDLKQAELELLKTEICLYRDIREYLHANSLQLIDALLTQFEIDNLKNAIRIYFDRQVRERTVDASVHYILHARIIHDLPIDIILNANSLDEIAGVLTSTPYGSIIRRYGHTVESSGSLFRLEIALDHFYYENLEKAIQRLDKRDQTIAIRLMGIEIDLQNISWIMRFKNFYDLPLETVLATIIPGGFNFSKTVISALYRTQNITSLLQGFVKGKYPGLSALCDSQATDSDSRLRLIQLILGEIKQHEVKRILSGYPFTIGIILAYFQLKRDELQKIRLVLNAKQYGQPQERIESML